MNDMKTGSLLSVLRKAAGNGGAGLPSGAHDNPLKSETEQSAVRLAFGVVFFAFGWFAYVLAGASDLPLKIWPFAVVYIAFAAVCLWHVRRWPDFNRRRLIVTTILDPLLVTALLFAGGERTIPIVWTYFWFVTAQGVRYGTPWMLLSQLTTTLAIAALTWFEPGWHRYSSFGLGIILSLASVAVFLSIANLRMSRLQQRLVQMASHDPLTGAANRTKLYDSLLQALWRCQRYGRRLAVLCFDLDGFKQVNDALGHRAGDHVLKVFTSRIGPALRRDDVIARIGGDEFVILMENVGGLANVNRVSELILSTLAGVTEFEGRALTVSASIGIATYPFLGMPDQVTPEQLLGRADAAMYLAKSKGKSRACVDLDAILGDEEINSGNNDKQL